MKSLKKPENVTFETLQLRLLKFLMHKLHSGEFTERGLSRILGISQPQMHNVLKGNRRLQCALADTMLLKFQIGIADLFSDTELGEALQKRIGAEHPNRLQD